MTTGTKIFRIIISILLALTMLWSIFVGLGLFAFGTRLIHTEEYGIWVAGISVERSNKGDILGDGTVFYDASNNVLVLNNATIEYEDTVVYSTIDLHIQLLDLDNLPPMEPACFASGTRVLLLLAGE